MANQRKVNLGLGQDEIANSPELQALIQEYVAQRGVGREGAPGYVLNSGANSAEKELLAALEAAGIDTHDLRLDSKTGALEEKGWISRNGGLAAAMALAPVGGAFLAPALMGGGAAAGGGGTAAATTGGTGVGANTIVDQVKNVTNPTKTGAMQGIEGFLKSPLGSELLKGGLKFGEGMFSPDAPTPFQFSELEGETGRLLTPENSAYNSMRANLGAGLGFARQAGAPTEFRNTMPGTTPSINIPGLGFDLGGVGQDKSTFEGMRAPGLDFSVPGNPNGDIVSMLEGLLRPSPPSNLVPTPSNPPATTPSGVPLARARMRNPR